MRKSTRCGRARERRRPPGAQGDGQQAPATGTQAAASQQQQREQASQWEESQRPAWQRHSDLGPNVDPEPSQLGGPGDRRAPRAPARPGARTVR